MIAEGKILKVRPGRDANCSSEAYIGYILVGFVAYGALLLVLFVTQLALRARRLADRTWIGRLRAGIWFGAHVASVVALLVWATQSGAMAYGSAIFVGAFVGVMLIVMGVGWVILSSRALKERWQSADPARRVRMVSACVLVLLVLAGLLGLQFALSVLAGAGLLGLAAWELWSRLRAEPAKE